MDNDNDASPLSFVPGTMVTAAAGLSMRSCRLGKNREQLQKQPQAS